MSDASGPRPDHHYPNFRVPPLATDTHMHVFGPADRFPMSPGRLYTPATATLDQYLAAIGQVGLQRVVVVQAAIYGSDNSALLDAMGRLEPDMRRGVVGIDAATTPGELEEFHRMGVRGARVSLRPAEPHDVDAARSIIKTCADRVRHLGWHVDVSGRTEMLASLAPFIRELGVPLVIDHMGHVHAEHGSNPPGFAELVALMRDTECWMKLSGAYRVAGQGAPLEKSAPFARAIAEVAPDRILWGSDWPHPITTSRNIPGARTLEDLDLGDLLDVLNFSLGDAGLVRKVLVDNPERLYGFPRTAAR